MAVLREFGAAMLRNVLPSSRDWAVKKQSRIVNRNNLIELHQTVFIAQAPRAGYHFCLEVTTPSPGVMTNNMVYSTRDSRVLTRNRLNREGRACKELLRAALCLLCDFRF